MMAIQVRFPRRELSVLSLTPKDSTCDMKASIEAVLFTDMTKHAKKGGRRKRMAYRAYKLLH